ncbi:gamma-butyrobetaine hydroxylase-like domain-containing protein [Pseudomonas sp. Marseille-P8916]|uniref:gamma-butyrobetaine hydroxylase-like domain-containing protein n=1 Tax=Pseudomonas sp. Marseille-P8916 TaxID=2866589 RepID=UPI0039A70D06
MSDCAVPAPARGAGRRSCAGGSPWCATKLRGGIALVRDDVRLERIAPHGYGVQLVFSDGHDKGIYPWAYLRELGGAALSAQDAPSG